VVEEGGPVAKNHSFLVESCHLLSIPLMSTPFSVIGTIAIAPLMSVVT
jgi:hypothetical protein